MRFLNCSFFECCEVAKVKGDNSPPYCTEQRMSGIICNDEFKIVIHLFDNSLTSKASSHHYKWKWPSHSPWAWMATTDNNSHNGSQRHCGRSAVFCSMWEEDEDNSWCDEGERIFLWLVQCLVAQCLNCCNLLCRVACLTVPGSASQGFRFRFAPVIVFCQVCHYFEVGFNKSGGHQ